MLTTFLLFYTDEDFAETFNPKMIPSLKVSSSFLNMEMNTSEKEAKKINVSDIQLSSPKLDHAMKVLDTLDMKNVRAEFGNIPTEFFDFIQLKSLQFDENVLDIFISSIVVGKYREQSDISNKFAVQLKTSLAVLLHNIVQTGVKIDAYIQRWAVGEYPLGMKVIFPRVMVRSTELVPQAKKLEYEKSIDFSLLAAPMILETVRADYHCLKVTFEREYDMVINLHIFQFLAKIEPKILAQFDSHQGSC